MRSVKDKETKKAQNTLLMIFAAAVIFAVAIGLCIYHTPENRLKRQLDLGNRYLEEARYEEAVLAFEKAVSIDERCTEVYIGLAKAYQGLGDYEQARQVLLMGRKATNDVKILELLNRMEDIEEVVQDSDSETEDDSEGDQEKIIEDEIEKEDASTNIYQQYYDKLIALQSRYGMCEDVVEDVWVDENRYLKGLCFAKLIDFNADGTEELIIAYNTGEDSEYLYVQNFIIEVWAYQDSAIKKVYSGEPMGDIDHGVGISLDFYEGNYYIYKYIEEFDEETFISQLIDEWYGYEKEAFGLVKRSVYSEGESVKATAINDREVSETEWSEDRNRWREAEEEYYFQNGEFYIDRSVDELTTTFKTLSEYLGIEWTDNISRVKEEKPYANSVWGADLIGYWENMYAQSLQEYVAATFYEDGVAELHTHNQVAFGNFEMEENGNVVVYLKDGYFYNNAEALWIYGAVNHQIRLTKGSHMYEMQCTYIGGNDEYLPPDSLVLNRVDDESADYSSAEQSLQFYKDAVSNGNVLR